MKKLAIAVAAVLLMCSSALAAAPVLTGKTFKGTGYGVENSGYGSMTITLKITSQSGARFKGTATTTSGGVTGPSQKFFAVISGGNQIYMVVQSTDPASEATEVLVDARYDAATNTIKGFWRGVTNSGAGYFTLKQVL